MLNVGQTNMKTQILSYFLSHIGTDVSAIKMKRGSLRKILSLILIFAFASAYGGETRSDNELTRVVQEIRDVLDNYRESMLTRDYDSMIDFWSKSDDFVMAGDGRILGGIDAWIKTTTGHYNSTEKWLVWDWQDVHIVPLSEKSAAATLELRFRWVDRDGNTNNSRGSWTYVFRKESEGWKVVHSNGTHEKLWAEVSARYSRTPPNKTRHEMWLAPLPTFVR